MLRGALRALTATYLLFAAAFAGTAQGQQPLSAAPKLVAPEGSSIERLGDAMIVNGRPMMIDHISVQRPAAEVLRHYRQALDEKVTGKIVERRLKGDHILARQIGENFVTVRVTPTLGGASEVWVMTTPMRPPASAAALPSHLTLPGGSRILSKVETVDGGRRAHTVIATSEAAVSATEDFLKRSLGERGFGLVASDESRRDSSRRVMLFQRGAEDVMVTIADGPAGRTLVLNASGPK